MGGREIGSALFSNGGTLGLGVIPSDVRSVLILGGRRGPDVPGISHNVCLFSTSRAAGVVCGSSKGTERGRDGPVDRGIGEAKNVGAVKAGVGTGCVSLGNVLDGTGGTEGDGFSGINVGALGFNTLLRGEGTVSERGC